MKSKQYSPAEAASIPEKTPWAFNKLFGGLGLTVLLVMVPASGWATPSSCDGIAGNLVSNCGFEAGGSSNAFTNWLVNRAPSGSDLLIGTVANSGTYAAEFTGNTPTNSPLIDSIGQILNTVAGDRYTFSFYLDVVPLSGGNNGETTFLAYWSAGGVDITQLLNLTSSSTIASGYQLYSYTVTADSTSMQITFEGNDPVGYNYLDDVVVTPVASSTVPEPASMLLVGTALAGLAMVRRRRV